MNNTVFYDADVSDDVRRQRLYDGQLFVYSPRASILAFTAFARSMIEDAFGGRELMFTQKLNSGEAAAICCQAPGMGC
jgi:hypothetical protein